MQGTAKSCVIPLVFAAVALFDVDFVALRVKPLRLLKVLATTTRALLFGKNCIPTISVFLIAHRKRTRLTSFSHGYSLNKK